MQYFACNNLSWINEKNITKNKIVVDRLHVPFDSHPICFQNQTLFPSPLQLPGCYIAFMTKLQWRQLKSAKRSASLCRSLGAWNYKKQCIVMQMFIDSLQNFTDQESFTVWPTGICTLHNIHYIAYHVQSEVPSESDHSSLAQLSTFFREQEIFCAWNVNVNQNRIHF